MSVWITYLIITAILIVAELVYFRVADKWKFLRKVTRSFSFESDPSFLTKVTRLS